MQDIINRILLYTLLILYSAKNVDKLKKLHVDLSANISTLGRTNVNSCFLAYLIRKF